MSLETYMIKISIDTSKHIGSSAVYGARMIQEILAIGAAKLNYGMLLTEAANDADHNLRVTLVYKKEE